ncbi:hypothetical protein [Rummeliibacillus pycnus]|uniref:hypothetical protein n=1 Tax=Rummeliibacillus pycnus TaxID=101070 RepID=UPI003D2B93B7
MLKRGIYGEYKNKEYEITKDMENNVIVITENRDKIDETFIDKYNNGLFRKIVKPNELSLCLRIKPYGMIDGEKVHILQEREDKYQIETADLLVGPKLNLPRVDRDSWLGWVPKTDVVLIEENEPVDPNDLV